MIDFPVNIPDLCIRTTLPVELMVDDESFFEWLNENDRVQDYYGNNMTVTPELMRDFLKSEYKTAFYGCFVEASNFADTLNDEIVNGNVDVNNFGELLMTIDIW